jgi:hypothetical protein
MVKGTVFAAGCPGLAMHAAGEKREQRTRESRAPRFGRSAAGVASQMAVGSPISPLMVNGTVFVAGGLDPAMHSGGGKREQRARESRGAICVAVATALDYG